MIRRFNFNYGPDHPLSESWMILEDWVVYIIMILWRHCICRGWFKNITSRSRNAVLALNSTVYLQRWILKSLVQVFQIFLQVFYMHIVLVKINSITAAQRPIILIRYPRLFTRGWWLSRDGYCWLNRILQHHNRNTAQQAFLTLWWGETQVIGPSKPRLLVLDFPQSSLSLVCVYKQLSVHTVDICFGPSSVWVGLSWIFIVRT